MPNITVHHRIPYLIPTAPDANVNSTLSRPLWRAAALPSGYIPSDSHEALRTHVAPPRPDRIPLNRQSEVTTVDDTDLDAAGLSGSGNSTASRPAAYTPSTLGNDSSTSPSVTPAKRPASSRMSSSKRKKSSHSHRPSSASQRAPKSDFARGFMQALGTRDFVFKYRSNLLSVVHNHLLANDVAPPNDSPDFLDAYLRHLLHEENAHSDYTPAGLQAMENGCTFSIYKERKPEWVTLKSLGQHEIADQAATLTGIARLANLFTSFPENLTARSASARSTSEGGPLEYVFSPDYKSGRIDISARPRADKDADGSPYTASSPTPMALEDKIGITFREFLCLIYVLEHGDLRLVDKGDGRRAFESPLLKLLSAATLLLLQQVGAPLWLSSFQIAQELHINKARYILLDAHDVSILFELTSSHTCDVSPLLFRDPQSLAVDFSDRNWLADVLRLVNPEEHRQAMITKYSVGSLRPEVQPEYSKLSILVAGLLASCAEVEGFWIQEDDYVNAIQRVQQSRTLSGPTRPPAAPDAGGGIVGNTLLRPGSSSGAGGSAMDLTSQLDEAPTIAAPVRRDQAVATKTMSGMQLSFSDDIQSEIRHMANYDILTHYLPVKRWKEHPEWQRVDRPMTKFVKLRRSDSSLISDVSMPSLSDDASNSDDSVWDVMQSPSAGRPDSALIVAGCDDLVVRVSSYVGSGRVWDVFRGTMSAAGTAKTHPVVIKFCNPSTNAGVRDEDGGELYSEKEMAEAVCNEVDLLQGPLRHLQGKVIPEFYGRWTHDWGSSQVSMVLMEDCGLPLDRIDICLPSDFRLKIRTAFHLIHDAGILHGDIKAEHILLHPSSDGVRIIDFEAAIVLGEVEKEVREEELREENARVSSLIHSFTSRGNKSIDGPSYNGAVESAWRGSADLEF